MDIERTETMKVEKTAGVRVGVKSVQIQLLFSSTGHNPLHMFTQAGSHFSFDMLGISI